MVTLFRNQPVFRFSCTFNISLHIYQILIQFMPLRGFPWYNAGKLNFTLDAMNMPLVALIRFVRLIVRLIRQGERNSKKAYKT